jgi:hypothetical protein
MIHSNENNCEDKINIEELQYLLSISDTWNKLSVESSNFKNFGRAVMTRTTRDNSEIVM